MNAIRRAGALTVHELFRATARGRPEEVAVLAGPRTSTFAALEDRVARVAGILARAGVERGDRIAFVSENRLDYLVTMLAAASLGIIVACQSWRLSPSELAHCIGLVTPELILVSARHAALLDASGAAKARTVIDLDRGWEERVAASEPVAADPSVEPEDGLLIIYTSGTTGLPKGAVVSHRAEIARMAVYQNDIGIGDHDAFVAWAPMFHMASADHMLAAVMSGAPTIVVDGLDCDAIVAAIRDHEIGWLLLMPGMIEPVLAAVRERSIVPKGIKAIGAMADLVPRQLIAEITGALRAPYLNTFGSTETGLPPASRGLLAAGAYPSSLAKTQSSLCDVRLVDPDGAVVPDGEPGELAIRGPTVFSGYWNNEEANARDFVDGYFRMGDMFRRGPDRTYDFVDRAKYLIKSGGENIYPAEIERVLLADRRIVEAVVVRKADAKWGEVPVAFVAVAPGCEEISEADVLAMCKDGLAGYKRPREVRFVAFDAFPRSATGKIQRHEVEKKWLTDPPM